MPQTISERLAAIEADNAALRDEVERLKSKVEPPRAAEPPGGTPYVERTVSVRTIADPPPPDITEADLRELRRIVGRVHPGLIAVSSGVSQHQALRQFGNALRAVGMLYGCAKFDEKHGLSWWTDHAQSIVDRGAGQNNFNSNDFTAAALASGVFYRAWSPSSSVEFGLARWQSHGSRDTTWPLRDAWRETLKRGAIVPPNAPAREPVDNRTGRLTIGPDR